MLAFRRTFAALRGLAFAVVVLAACSSDPPAAATCDSAQCAPGNKCLPLDGETKCRKTCSSNSDASASCPFGYVCKDPLTGDEPFCVQDKAINFDGAPLVQRESGQWGAPCQANLGADNPGCDRDQQFWCYGISPTDGNAYCTRYDCTSDDECGAGFWCAQINQTPNVNTARRSTFGEVQSVCLRRTYCSTCTVDLDCPTIAGKQQFCIPDANGNTFCSPECETSQNCPNEARCTRFSGIDVKVCYPRAKVCVGDGSLCSPCRVDTDCGEDGICLKGEYTTEWACAKKAKDDCKSCPDTIESPDRLIGCATKASPGIPAGYCLGLYKIGAEPSDIGCWTPDR